MIRQLRYIVSFISALSCLVMMVVTTSGAKADTDGWKSYRSGISLRSESLTGDNPLRIFVARIDTKSPGIRFFVTPSNGDEPSDASALATSEFLQKYSCQLAINGSVFSPYAKQKGDPLDILGLSISDGSLYSKPNRFHALLFLQSGKSIIATPPFDTKVVKNGLSGYYTILQNGKNLGSERKKDPRSVAGLSKDGRYLYLAVFDGRQPGYSDGATLREAAEWMKRFGAWTALNLDGGGSSTLVVQEKDGSTRILNRPSDGAERRVANHLCVFTNKERNTVAK